MASDKRLYLQLGDNVLHRDYEQWGAGRVVEVMTSTLPGGTCLVRIMFADGRQRTFSNDLDNQSCCFYFGLRKQWRELDDESPQPRPSRRRLSRG